DRADQFGGIERHDPFGQVAHDDSDAVALLHAVGLKPRRELERRAGEGLVGAAVVLIDQEFAVAIHPPGEEDFLVGRRAVLPHAGGNAADDDGLHLEAGARRGQRGGGVLDRHGGPVGGKSHSVACSARLRWDIIVIPAQRCKAPPRPCGAETEWLVQPGGNSARSWSDRTPTLWTFPGIALPRQAAGFAEADQPVLAIVPQGEAGAAQAL